EGRAGEAEALFVLEPAEGVQQRGGQRRLDGALEHDVAVVAKAAEGVAVGHAARAGAPWPSAARRARRSASAEAAISPRKAGSTRVAIKPSKAARLRLAVSL